MNELCIGFPRRAPERCPLRMGRARAGVLRISEAALMRASSPVTRGQFAALCEEWDLLLGLLGSAWWGTRFLVLLQGISQRANVRQSASLPGSDWRVRTHLHVHALVEDPDGKISQGESHYPSRTQHGSSPCTRLACPCAAYSMFMIHIWCHTANRMCHPLHFLLQRNPLRLGTHLTDKSGARHCKA